MAATGTEAIIAETVLEYLADMQVGSPPLEIAMPGRAFTPTEEAYLRADWIPNRTRALSLGVDDPNQHQGLLQITVLWPLDRGIIAPADIASEIAEYFERGTTLTSGDITVRFEQAPTVGPALKLPDTSVTRLQASDRIQIPVTIPWIAFV